MIDKLEFNNQLLANKSKVQKAKINVINKLVQKIRKLKTLLEKHPENEKISNKLTKMTNLLPCLKKIKPTDFLKRAILNTKNSTVIISNRNSTLEEIADALLCSHKIIIEIIEKLKILFTLNDSNSGWQEEISELSKKQRKTLKIEEKQQKRQERKIKNELLQKRTKWLEENLPDNNKNQQINTKKPINSNDQEDIILNHISECHVDNKSQDTVKSKSKSPVKKQKKSESEEIHTEKKQKKSELEEIHTEKTIDPFFITSTGENYLSIVTISNSHKSQSEDENDNSFFGQKKTRKFHKNFSNLNDTRKFSKNQFYGKNDDLSWKAKQNPQRLKKFQNKREVFDEELKNNEQTINNLENNLNNVFDSNNKDLHPSWAAKQKLKPKIQAFQGKKVVFEDD